MKIDLLDSEKLSKIKNPKKLKNCLEVSLRDAKEVVKILKEAAGHKGKSDFFCFLRCTKGFGMDILVKPDLLEVEFKSIGCDFCNDKCSDRYSFCNNFNIYTEYVIFKNQAETEKIFNIGGKDEFRVFEKVV